MTKSEMTGLQYIKDKSIVSNNTGHTPLQAKYNKTFFDSETFSRWSITDLDLKKKRRTSAIKEFRDKYSRLYALNRVSLFTGIVNQENYPEISKFINTISKKFKRKEIKKLGHVWVRDIGDIKFEKHFHILIATDFVDKSTFKAMFTKKTHSKYKIQYIETPKGISEYLMKKELYASKGEKAYQKSLYFLKPKA